MNLHKLNKLSSFCFKFCILFGSLYVARWKLYRYYVNFATQVWRSCLEILSSISVETVTNLRTSWSVQADGAADESYQLKLCWNWIGRHPSFTAATNFFVHSSVHFFDLMKITETERQFIKKIGLISEAFVNWIDEIV